MHNLIAGESVSRISRQSGHALPQHWMPSAWNRTLSIGLSPAGVYSVFAKVTDCLQSGYIWPPSLKLGPEVFIIIIIIVILQHCMVGCDSSWCDGE